MEPSFTFGPEWFTAIAAPALGAAVPALIWFAWAFVIERDHRAAWRVAAFVLGLALTVGLLAAAGAATPRAGLPIIHFDGGFVLGSFVVLVATRLCPDESNAAGSGPAA